jgi:hypothetical protein
MMNFSGTVRTCGAYAVGQDKKLLLSIVAADEIGNTYSLQMWPDDPQHAELSQSIANVRHMRIVCVIAGYSARMRKMKDGKEQPQANFIMSQVRFDAVQPLAS